MDIVLQHQIFVVENECVFMDILLMSSISMYLRLARYIHHQYILITFLENVMWSQLEYVSYKNYLLLQITSVTSRMQTCMQWNSSHKSVFHIYSTVTGKWQAAERNMKAPNGVKSCFPSKEP